MIGTKCVSSLALLVVVGGVVFSLLSPVRVAALAASTLFWIGAAASVVGPLVVRFWRIDRRSAKCFRYSYDEELWVDEAHFLAVGPHQISIADNEGEALDLPAGLQYSIYIVLAFLIGLLTIDGRAISLVQELPSKLTMAGSQYCPEEEEEEETSADESPGCALVRRAFELGYAKSLGSCGDKEKEETTEICLMRQHDEPFLHYTWRLLQGAWTSLQGIVSTESLANLREVFEAKTDHLDTLFAAQALVLGTGPRASHHIWTNLPDPQGWLHAATGGALDPGRCIDAFERLPHRPKTNGEGAHQASIMLIHALGKLLFEPRYAPAAGFCREYTIHWASPADACDQLAENTEVFLEEAGALGQVRAVLDRHDLNQDLQELPDAATNGSGGLLSRQPDTASGESRLGGDAPPIQRFLSFLCYVEEERPAPERSVRPFSLGPHRFVAEQLRVPSDGDASNAEVDRYGYLATLLVRGFHYGGLMSEASIDFGDGGGASAAAFADGPFRLATLDGLADLDMFLGNGWIMRTEHLRDLYPYHLHLKNYVEIFRRQYLLERGRM